MSVRTNYMTRNKFTFYDLITSCFAVYDYKCQKKKNLESYNFADTETTGHATTWSARGIVIPVST
jgi:hypothetical protein